jgi:hypothetical protein
LGIIWTYLSALRSGSFIHGERASGNYRILCPGGPKAGLDAVKKKKSLVSAGNRTPIPREEKKGDKVIKKRTVKRKEKQK